LCLEHWHAGHLLLLPLLLPLLVLLLLLQFPRPV